MDQLKLCMTSEEKAYELIRPVLCQVLTQNGLPESYLSLEERNAYYSVIFNSTSLLVRIANGKKPYIEIARNGRYKKIPLAKIEDIQNHIEEISDALVNSINTLPKEFDCCSRYMECSDAKKCTHPDTAFSIKCGYRKVLNSGRIFFGKNKNS